MFKIHKIFIWFKQLFCKHDYKRQDFGIVFYYCDKCEKVIEIDYDTDK